ncbi:MAG: hypothetical protein K2G22_08020 [Eubacterium sp.]|nr:hypothetical protein [Eubacterium sp.]
MKRKNIILIVLGIIVILIAVIIIAANSNRSEIHSYSVNVTDANNVSVEMTTPLHKTEVPDGYIGIYTIDDFDYIRTTPSNNYILMNDLDFSGVVDWNPPDMKNGLFDGNNYTIKNYKQNVSLFNECLNTTMQNLNMENVETTSNSIICRELGVNSGDTVGLINCNCSGVLKCSISDNMYYGFIEYDDSKVDVNIGGLVGLMTIYTDGNLVVDACSFDGKIDVELDWKQISKFYADKKSHSYSFNNFNIGGLIGKSSKCTITNSKTKGNIVVNITDLRQWINIGGIVGKLPIDSNVLNCENGININSTNNDVHAGGIVGLTAGYNNLVFRETFNSGNIELNGIGNTAGGILGYSYNSYMPFMYDCYNAGDISASNAGGLSSSSAIISGCYNVGTISGTEKAGELTADKSEQIEYSYYLNNGVDVTGEGGKYPYVKALSEEEMKNPSSFEWLNFNNVWTFSDGDYKYPTLINCP